MASGSGDATIILWDMHGRNVQQWVAHGRYDRHTTVWTLAFSPDGRHLASGASRDRRLVIWELSQSGHKPIVLDGHVGVVFTCAWCPNGDVVASGSQDGSVLLWDVTPTRIQHLPPRILLGPCSEKVVLHVAFSPDGVRLAAISSGGAYCDCRIWAVASGTLDVSISIYGPTICGFATFVPGRTHLATLAMRAAAEIWNVETGKSQFLLEQGRNASLCYVSFSPDGKLLATASIHWAVKLWDAHTGAELHSLRHTTRVQAMSFSPCGKYIASASWDRTTPVRLWRARDGACVATFDEHRDVVNHVAFSPDGRTLWYADKAGMVVFNCLRDIIEAEDEP